MTKILAIALALAVSGCAATNDAEEAEERFEMAMKHGTDREQCDTAREAARLWLERQDELKYRTWSSYAVVQCMDVPLQLEYVD